jgi:3-hydroxyacyl-[acyl-carrier-protein] dehydratase
VPNEKSLDEIPDLSFLKQGFPLLMVDKVLSWEKGRELRTIKNISINEVFFQGHFPEHPVFPGVLTIECFAQTASILIRLTEGSAVKGVFDAIGAVMDFRFLKPIFPGDRLEVHMLITKTAGPNRMFEGKGYVGGEEVASGKFLIGKLRVP